MTRQAAHAPVLLLRVPRFLYTLAAETHSYSGAASQIVSQSFCHSQSGCILIGRPCIFSSPESICVDTTLSACSMACTWQAILRLHMAALECKAMLCLSALRPLSYSWYASAQRPAWKSSFPATRHRSPTWRCSIFLQYANASAWNSESSHRHWQSRTTYSRQIWHLLWRSSASFSRALSSGR